jgi:two-component system NtrC family sensor kinase
MASNDPVASQLEALIEQTYKVEEQYVALRSSYAHLQETIEQIIEFLPNAIWVFNADGTVFLQNSKAKELSDLLGALDVEKNDYEVHYEARSFLVKTSIYKEKFLLSATDITEQKRKENLATMGQMAAHLSHEIRNPIGSISLLTSTLMKRVVTKNKPIVLEIQKSVYRIERIIKATLMFSRGVKANRQEITWSELRRAIETATGYYSYGKSIRFIFPEDDFALYGDPELLSMLFTNLIYNAIDAIESDESEEGSIEITHELNNGSHRFRIYDSGIAIAQKGILFEAFSSTKERGNGLGLALSRQIARAHGGDVRLAEGKKKEFVVTIDRGDH